MYCTVISAAIDGISSRRVCVEADVADGLPTFSMVGFLASETREAAEIGSAPPFATAVFIFLRSMSPSISPRRLFTRRALCLTWRSPSL